LHTLSGVAQRTGISPCTLEAWLHRGFIHPQTRVNGSGHRNLFSEEDIEKIGLFKSLSNLGFSKTLVSKIVFEGDTEAMNSLLEIFKRLVGLTYAGIRGDLSAQG